jgi:hypothetical protein
MHSPGAVVLARSGPMHSPCTVVLAGWAPCRRLARWVGPGPSAPMESPGTVGRAVRPHPVAWLGVRAVSACEGAPTCRSGLGGAGMSSGAGMSPGPRVSCQPPSWTARWWARHTRARLVRSVGPPWSQCRRWWASHQVRGRWQWGKTQPRSRTARALRWAGWMTRVVRPTSSGWVGAPPRVGGTGSWRPGAGRSARRSRSGGGVGVVSRRWGDGFPVVPRRSGRGLGMAPGRWDRARGRGPGGQGAGG